MTRITSACLALLFTWLAPAAGQTAPVSFSEVYYDAVGSDQGLLFVELYGAPGTALDGYVVEGVNGANGDVGPVIALAGAIGGGGFFVVADEDGGASSVAAADQLANFDLQNGPDSVVLRDALGAVLDALGYGDFSGGEIFAGEGQPAPDPPAGESLARRFANVDTNDNAADFVALAAPTPGTGPLALPEPGLSLVVGAALLGLCIRR